MTQKRGVLFSLSKDKGKDHTERLNDFLRFMWEVWKTQKQSQSQDFGRNFRYLHYKCKSGLTQGLQSLCLFEIRPLKRVHNQATTATNYLGKTQSLFLTPAPQSSVRQSALCCPTKIQWELIKDCNLSLATQKLKLHVH